MNTIRVTFLAAALAAGVSAFGEGLPAASAPAPQSPAVAAAAALFAVPKVGIRVGGGQWHEFMLDLGADVTFHVPFLPLPAIRIDGEVWSKPNGFGDDRRGNALSVLGVQTLPLGGYFGLGPSYYFSDNQGDHKSGFGAKLLGGWQFGRNYVEAGLIVGPNPAPLFLSVGTHF